MLQNYFEKAHAILLIVDGPSQQRLRKSLYSGERRSKFVRYVGHKSAAHTFQTAQFGDVVQHQYGAESIACTHGRYRGGKIFLSQRSSDDFRFHPGFAAQYMPHRLDQFRLANNFYQRAARFRRELQIKYFRKSLISEKQAFRTVHYRNT